MDSRYFLASARLGFRAWRKDDLPLAMELWTDVRVTGFFGGPYSPERVQARLAEEMAHQRESGMQYWPIFLLEDGRHVGVCGLRPWKPAETIPELGFHLRPEFWRRGLAFEAATAAIQVGFARLGASAIFAGHHPENVGSRNLLLKLGFQYAGEEVYPASGMLEPTYLLRASDRFPTQES
ncbi:MAG TPA: GNAT family N-acetyltransferase [Terracidiphilus sp.]|jgi:RimJ/RimL family protein N-acetyltransferase|nr:GNAT family N-acetyltransferase [Terracidiphilus sp.]